VGFRWRRGLSSQLCVGYNRKRVASSQLVAHTGSNQCSNLLIWLAFQRRYRGARAQKPGLDTGISACRRPFAGRSLRGPCGLLKHVHHVLHMSVRGSVMPQHTRGINDGSGECQPIPSSRRTGYRRASRDELICCTCSSPAERCSLCGDGQLIKATQDHEGCVERIERFHAGWIFH
jgi:hypothetical protein